MHARASAAAHLIPIVSRHFQLGRDRHLDLRDGQQVVETRLPGNLLGEKPQHLIARGAVREPRKQRIALARAAVLQLLEPIDEFVDTAGDGGCQRRDLFPHGLDIIALGKHHLGILVHVVAPSLAGESRLELPAVVFRQIGVKSVEGGTVEMIAGLGPYSLVRGHGIILA